MPKVSIIVAAYNAEKYLDRCLRSIADQTMPDFEAIIVDDGSTDGTARIAQSYVAQDKRFHLIKEGQNCGQSKARQDAMDFASGYYSIHIDSDDWVEPDMLEGLVSYAESSGFDMVIFDWIRTTEEGPIYEDQTPRSLETSVVWGQMMQPELHASLCNKLIRRACYEEYGIRFIPGMLMEDQYICLCMLSHPIKVGYLHKAYYHYDTTANPQSTVHRGIRPEMRLKPLELIAETSDLSPALAYYNKALLYIAYEALFFSKKDCPNYSQLFKKHLSSIKQASGLPFRVKLLVILRIYGIPIPIRRIKQILGRI